MKAMVLAAGSGTRLLPLTDSIPKPLVPIANVPLLDRTLNWLAGQGITDVVVNANHLAEMIVTHVGDGTQFGLRATISVEDRLLGTAGAVKNCEAYFQDTPFYVIYGDNLIDANLASLLEFHQSRSADATIALFTPEDISACGAVELDQYSRVERFVEKPKPGESESTLANAGIYILEPKLLELLPDGFSDFGNDIFPDWLRKGLNIYATPLNGYLQDTGTPERYRQANWDVITGKTGNIPKGSQVDQSWMGDRCQIDSSAMLIGKNVLGDRVVIGANSRLIGSVVWPGAKIEADCELANVIVGADATVSKGTRASSTIIV